MFITDQILKKKYWLTILHWRNSLSVELKTPWKVLTQEIVNFRHVELKTFAVLREEVTRILMLLKLESLIFQTRTFGWADEVWRNKTKTRRGRA